MTTLKSWLDANYGLATKLTKVLGVNATCISKVKHGISPLPTRWIPVLVRLSKGLLKTDSLLQERLAVSKR
jgi:hypothetical protein